VRYACEDIDLLRRGLRALERDIEQRLAPHQVGQLLSTIDGIGPLTAACLIAELGDPARFCRRCTAPAAIGQETLLREFNNSVRERLLAEGALDGGSQRSPLQSVVASVL
jgi:transposase